MSHRQPLLPLAFLLACATAGALRAQTRADRGASPAARDTCDSSVAFLFLAREGLPLESVWRKFLDGCQPGSYTLHVHSQGNFTQAVLPEAQLVSDPVQGELRRNYTMQQAMHRLYRDASGATAPNGCQPRWAQMLSDACAPLRSCGDLQAFLGAHRGTSFMESWLCTVGARADACYSRRIWSWKTPWYKAHQWSTLWMDHARLLLAHEQDNLKMWSGVHVPDEHYTVNILDSLGANHTAFGLTHVYPFLPGRKAHPGDVQCALAPKQKALGAGQHNFSTCVQDVTSAGRIFARKFETGCTQHLLDNLPDPVVSRQRFEVASSQ